MNDGPQRDEWTPHIWDGAGFFAWCKLLRAHRFAVHPRYWWVVVVITGISFFHSVLWLLQEAFIGHRFRRVPTPRDPIFILGHWRSGTTLLHELLIRDERHASPNTYQCFDPSHFHLTERFAATLLSFMMPARRPMDDMPAGWDRPQEDEFAMCMLGQPSPYLQIAFPNQPFEDIDSLDLRNLDAAGKQKWSQVLAHFLRRVSHLHPGKRLVLKSPPHSARIATLLKQFPEARFIHIVRDPVKVFPSTVRLWKALYKYHALQVPTYAELDRYVFESGRRLFTALEAGKRLIPAGRLVEVRYEDVITDPVGQIRHIYEMLNLGDSTQLEPEIREYMSVSKPTRPNRNAMSEELVADIDREWGEIIQHYGYERTEADADRATSPLPAEPLLASIP